jgi:hypothetical protein
MGDGAERPLKAIAKRSVEKPTYTHLFCIVVAMSLLAQLATDVNSQLDNR